MSVDVSVVFCPLSCLHVLMLADMSVVLSSFFVVSVVSYSVLCLLSYVRDMSVVMCLLLC